MVLNPQRCPNIKIKKSKKSLSCNEFKCLVNVLVLWHLDPPQAALYILCSWVPSYSNQHSMENITAVSQGTYGKVSKAILDGKPVAIKQIPLNKYAKTFENECYFGFQTRNFEHTVKVLKTYIQGDNGYIIMDLCQYDIYKLIKDTKLCEKRVAFLFYRICMAIKELHDAFIAHLDIKLENILLGDNLQFKICDFGSAVTFEGNRRIDLTRNAGTPHYVAPELEHKKNILPASADIWSLGILLHVLLIRNFPVRYQSIYISPSNLTFAYTEGLSKKAQHLLKSMLNFDPVKRPTIDEVLAHPWLGVGQRKSAFW